MFFFITRHQLRLSFCETFSFYLNLLNVKISHFLMTSALS